MTAAVKSRRNLSEMRSERKALSRNVEGRNIKPVIFIMYIMAAGEAKINKLYESIKRNHRP